MFVGNLHYDTTKEELGALMAGAGSVIDLHLPTDRETGRPRGFAFVGFATETEAAEAVRRFNQVEMRGRKLNVNAADDRPRRAPGVPSLPFRRPPGDGGGFAAGGPFGGDPALAAEAGFAGGGGFGGGRGDAQPRRFKSKGSRRGLRRRKRSL